MRLPSDEERAIATVAAAFAAGISVFDTAHAYGPDPDRPGENERLLAKALGADPARARIVTKGGMRRTGGEWVPDGRAKSILADGEASRTALGGREIDLYLLHAPDPRTPWETSVRALAKLAEDRVVTRVGVSNVNRRQLDQACELAPIAAVEVALSWFDDRAVRGGVLERCGERGISVIAHSPLGGPKRAARLDRRDELAAIAQARGVTAAQVALAWLLDLSDGVIAIPGARRPETARSSAQAALIVLRDAERAALDRPRLVRVPSRPRTDSAEVVLIMGIPGAGKSVIATEYVDRGYRRLNRDARGGTLRALADALEEQLAAGVGRLVLDNTYVSRAERSRVLEAARAHGVPVRCTWIDVPLDQAQVNLVTRIVERFGRLPAPEELRAAARREPGLMLPTSQMRLLRELEAPSLDEGFQSVEHVPFARVPATEVTGRGVLVGAAALDRRGVGAALRTADPSAPHLIFDWRPGGRSDDLAELRTRTDVVTGPVDIALCPHRAGPPACWCRPPLPGLAIAFAHAHHIDPGRLTVIGCSAAHRTLARTLAATYVPVD